MVKVLRVENSEGIGMYACRIWDKEMGSYPRYTYEMTEASNHPNPLEDAALFPVWVELGYKNRSKWNFGFVDLAQLRNWIYRQSWRDELKKYHFMISIYEVDAENFHAGDTQCIFIKKNATLIERFSFDEIYTKEV